jgi:predicted amidohydrolase
MNEKLTVAVCQLRTELDTAQTMEKAAAFVRDAAERGADFVVLPEMFNCPYSSRFFRRVAAEGHEKAVAAMSGWARENGVYLVGGSVPELEDGKLYNSCFVFDRAGKQIARHRKVHLFDVDLPGMRFHESDSFAPGSKITVFDTEFGKMGAAICFDVRFPELFRAMAVRGAKIVFLPAQFNMTTGPAHWADTLKLRAVDNEIFFVGASAARYAGFDYECWGHSMVLDPYGVTLAAADEPEQTIFAGIDLARIDEVRAQLPTFLKLRRDVYRVAE